MRSILSKIAMVVFSLLFGLAVVEVGLRAFNPVEIRLRGTQINLPHFRKYVVTIENPRVLEPRIIHTKNALGFRGPDKPKSFDEKLSIVAIGGSTTECYVLADGRDWPAVLGFRLEKNFRDLWINNAGQNGHTTLGHIRMMRQHVIGLKPKVVIFLVGVNDTSFDDNHARFDSRLDLDSEDDVFKRYVRKIEKAVYERSHALSFLYQMYRQWRASRVHDLDSHIEKDFVAWAKNVDPLDAAGIRKIRADMATKG